MAISTNTFSLNSGYTKQQMITQLEDAFTWLGWHDKCDHTGIVTGLVDYGIFQDDTNDTTYTRYFYSAEQYTSSGIGTGASFFMSRYNGTPNYTYVVKPGYGYTNGEYLEFLPGEATETASGLGWGCTVFVDDSVSYGTTHNGFYTKNIHAGNNWPYGVLRHKIEDNKKYGVTYRAFQAPNTTQIKMGSGSFFHPLDPDPTGSNTYGGGNSSTLNVPRFAGQYKCDVGWHMQSSRGTEYPNPKSSYFEDTGDAHYVASSNTYQLDLNIFRSGIDTSFAVFSYRQPTLSSTKLTNNTFFTFIPHAFSSPVWDLDHVFLGGYTQINPQDSDANNYVGIQLETLPYGSADNGSSYGPEYQIRCAEAPYDRDNDGIFTNYRSNLAYGSPHNYTYGYHLRTYNRDATYDNNGMASYASQSTGTVDVGANYNAIIKGIPINAMMVPSPYNMPDDFGLVDFVYDAPSVNIQQGDTITINETEVWVVISGAYNQNTKTRGLLFVARKV